MLNIKEIKIPHYEKVIEATDPDSGLHCFIAIHNTALGPSMGGTRIYPYNTPEEALQDVLRLSKAMTYKSALAENGLGGGKAVIIANPKTQKTNKLLQSYGEVVNSLKGLYIAAEDVGSDAQDMEIVRQKTPFVGALPTEKSSGDPSRFTAWGVFRGIKAVAKKLWGDECLRKKVISIQGLGHVGSKLANILFWEGANLIICDKDSKETHDHAMSYGGTIINTNNFVSTPCDILAPCALGGIINSESIPLLKCKAIAGCANNQLQIPENGKELQKRGILYAPDYVINAGGIINAATEFEPNGYNPAIARDKVNHIYDTLLQIFEIAEKEHKPTNQVADELAEYKLNHQIGKRQHPLMGFHPKSWQRG